MTTSPKPSQLNAALVMLAFVALGAGMILAVIRAPEPPQVPGLLWPDPPVVASFALESATGGPLTEAALRNRWTLLFFGFTHCPDVCPTTLAVLKQAVAKLKDDPLYRDKGQVILISVDPERDSPEKLATYVHYFNPEFLAATGSDAALNALTGPLSVIRAKVPDGKDSYTVDHTAAIFLIDPALRVLGRFSPPHDPASLAAGFRAISAFGTEHP